MASCSKTGENKYPIRRRIETEKAIENIVNWIDNDKEHSDEDDSIDSELESSEEEFEEDEMIAVAAPPPLSPPPQQVIPSASVQSSTPPVADNNLDNDSLSDSTNSSKKRKRGRPSLDKQNVNKQQPKTSTKNGSNPAEQIDVWNEIIDNDSRKHEFRFVPQKVPGVHANLNGDSTPLDSFFQLFDEDVQSKLISYMNAYAEHKLATKFPASRGSRFANWYPMTKYELFKFLAVVIAMGIDKRPTIAEYWSTDDTLYTPWYGQQFSRNRFEMIYSTMLHAVDVADELEKKDKIEPFLNMLLQKFQAAF